MIVWYHCKEDILGFHLSSFLYLSENHRGHITSLSHRELVFLQIFTPKCLPPHLLKAFSQMLSWLLLCDFCFVPYCSDSSLFSASKSCNNKKNERKYCHYLMCIFVFSKYKILVVYFDTFSRPVFLYFILIHFMTKYLYFVSKYFMMYLCPALAVHKGTFNQCNGYIECPVLEYIQ